MKKYRVLYVEDDPTGERRLIKSLKESGLEVKLCASESELEEELSTHTCGYQVALVDYRLEESFTSRYKNGIEVTRALQRRWPELELIGVSRFLEVSLDPGASQIAAEWVLAGARWFCRKQDLESKHRARQTIEIIKSCAKRVDRVRAKLELPGYSRLDKYKGLSETVKLIDRLASIPSPILLLGETGVGKGYLARYLHDKSGRTGLFVEVNCGAIPEALAESELFGHVKGSFTGAIRTTQGKFVLADGGTLLLDEIGDLPIFQQTKLLDVLESGQVWAVGAPAPRLVDVRVIFATHRNLLEEVDKGNFREDLFFRISAFPVRIPSLSERREDIRSLVREEFFPRYARAYGRTPSLTEDALNYLENREYPGNVRELENVIRRLVALSEVDVIGRTEASEVDRLSLSLVRTGNQSEILRTREQYAAALAKWMSENIEELGVSKDFRTVTSFIRAAVEHVKGRYELARRFPKTERFLLRKYIAPRFPDLAEVLKKSIRKG